MQPKYTYADLIPELTGFMSLFTDRHLPHDNDSFEGDNSHFNLNLNERVHFMGFRFSGVFNTRSLYGELALLLMMNELTQSHLFWDVELGVADLDLNLLSVARSVFEIGIDERKVRQKFILEEKHIKSIKTELTWALQDHINPKIVFQFIKYLIIKNLKMDQLTEKHYLDLTPAVVQNFGIQQAFIDLYKFSGLDDRLINAIKLRLGLETISNDYFFLKVSYMIYGFVKWYTGKNEALMQLESVDEELDKYNLVDKPFLAHLGVDIL